MKSVVPGRLFSQPGTLYDEGENWIVMGWIAKDLPSGMTWAWLGSGMGGLYRAFSRRKVLSVMCRHLCVLPTGSSLDRCKGQGLGQWALSS